jgi:hypothetical protein
MPPKKKKGKKGKKKGKDGELTESDKLKLKTHEIDALKDNLALRKDFNRRTKFVYEEMKDKLNETNKNIEEIESIHKASSAYLTHQYKTLQNDMTIKMHNLESELVNTQRQLEATEKKLEEEIKEKNTIIQEKNEKISDLEQKIANIQIMYDSIISLTLDNFNQNIEKKKLSWEDKSIQLQTKNKKLLAELGVNIHHI